MKNDWSKILLSPLFLFGLCLLIANDFIFKQQFHNFLTGKLSDFVGLFTFPLFFLAFFPKRKAFIYIFTGLFFVYWKSEFSASFISFWNSFELFQIARTVDYSDLSALLILPFSYIYGEFRLDKESIDFRLKPVLLSSVILVSSFAFIATSLADEGSIYVKETYETNFSIIEIEQALKQNPKTDDFHNTYYESNNNVGNLYSNKVDSSHFYFTLNYKICDTNYPRVSFVAIKKHPKTEINLVSFHFRCASFAEENSNSAKQEYVPAVKEIFEKEIMAYLNQTK
jgi:hypothetical protein